MQSIKKVCAGLLLVASAFAIPVSTTPASVDTAEEQTMIVGPDYVIIISDGRTTVI